MWVHLGFDIVLLSSNQCYVIFLSVIYAMKVIVSIVYILVMIVIKTEI